MTINVIGSTGAPTYCASLLASTALGLPPYSEKLFAVLPFASRSGPPEAMIELMQSKHGLSKRDVIALASLRVDLRIPHIVNGVRGVHAVLGDGVTQVP